MRINAVGTGNVTVSIYFVEYFCLVATTLMSSATIFISIYIIFTISITQGCDPQASSIGLF